MYYGMLCEEVMNRSMEQEMKQQKYSVIKINNYFINVNNIKKIIIFEGENM